MSELEVVPPYIPISGEERIRVLETFSAKMEESKDLDPEIYKILEEEFWNLLDK